MAVLRARMAPGITLLIQARENYDDHTTPSRWTFSCVAGGCHKGAGVRILSRWQNYSPVQDLGPISCVLLSVYGKALIGTAITDIRCKKVVCLGGYITQKIRVGRSAFYLFIFLPCLNVEWHYFSECETCHGSCSFWLVLYKLCARQYSRSEEIPFSS